MQKHFPELCKQITARHAVVVKRRHEEKLAMHCSRIRQAVLVLHQQVIYPSRMQIGKLLKDMRIIYFLRTPEGQEAWKASLEELGYAVE